MVQVTTVSGSESFRAGSATFRVHAANSRAFPLVSADYPKSFIGKANQGVVSLGRTTKLYASTSPLDALGVYWQNNYDVAEGMVLVVEATKSIPMSTRGQNMSRKALVGLRVREHAPLVAVKLIRVADPLMAHFDVYLQGRMDILSYIDMLRLGADPSCGRMGDLPLYAPTRRASLLDVVTISPQIAAPPQRVVERVQVDDDGTTVAVSSSRRQRHVDLGD